MKIRLLTSVVASGVLVGALAVCPTAAQAQPDPSPPVAARAMPSEIPSATTPGITAGSNVTEFAEVGNKVFAAGNFSEVGGQARAGVAAFNNQTGALDQSFNPNILGQLNTVAAGPTPNTVYVAGSVRSAPGRHDRRPHPELQAAGHQLARQRRQSPQRHALRHRLLHHRRWPTAWWRGEP
jgi:hypothetical protein